MTMRYGRKPEIKAPSAVPGGLDAEIAEFLKAKERQRTTTPGRDYVSSATILQLRANLKPFVAWATRQRPAITSVRDVTDEVKQRYEDYMRSRSSNRGGKLSRDTVRTHLRNLNTLTNWFGMPKGDYRLPQGAQHENWETLTKAEIVTMERAAITPRDALIIATLAQTGCRLGELLSLRGRDLVFDSHTRRYEILVVGKTGPNRIAVLPELFKRLRAEADRRGNDAEPIFIAARRRPDGKFHPLTPSGVEQMIRKTAQDAKVSRKKDDPRGERRVYAHLFRHSWATEALRAGVSPVVVAKHLGHKSLAMVTRVYAHLNTTDTAEALKLMFSAA